MKYIRTFDTLLINDVELVGGKNASLGQMIRALSPQGILIPDGFAVTADGYWHYIHYNNLLEPIKQLLHRLHDVDINTVEYVGSSIRNLIVHATMPDDLAEEIKQAYQQLSKHYHKRSANVAVRSSATAEDLPGASFAGQQETYLNITGVPALLEACKKCFASLFTNRAIVYRIAKGFDHVKVGLSIGVQKMVRSDLACSGVAFSLDTETGFKNVVLIEAAYGLGELLVRGEVMPDEYRVFKPMLQQGYAPIIEKIAGLKQYKLIYGKRDALKRVKVAADKATQFCLTDKEILELAQSVSIIEQYYSKINGHWTPMDVEWAKDGHDHKIYIVQARPETVHALEQNKLLQQYQLQTTAEPILQGTSIGQKIATGPVHVMHSTDQRDFKAGSILVTTMTDPDWVPIMRKAAGIITDLGGRTCHTAIVARELGIPALVGTLDATKKLKNGQQITMDCSKGTTGAVYNGTLAYTIQEIDPATLSESPVRLLVNIADPSGAFSACRLPQVSGVGLARIEFIIANRIKAHPMALLHPEKIQNKCVKKQIAHLIAAYPSGKDFFINTLAQGVATIAAAFWPRPVLVRFSDFKSNEYANLLGGNAFEPEESNPMMGLRGASRYYSPWYEEAFVLEIAAIKKARTIMGLENISVMIPFVRTVQEAELVLHLFKKHGLYENAQGLQTVMMVEIPANVILLDQFCALFDGFSIGSNDLTQFALAVDRDSSLLASLFDEEDEAVTALMKQAIVVAHRHKKFIGICGQAPSDYPAIRKFLIDNGIDSISLNTDAIIPFLMQLKHGG